MRKLIFKHRLASVFVLIVVLGGGYFGYTLLKGNSSVQPQYVTAKVARGTLVVSVSGSGQIAASNQINVQPQASGVVTAIPVSNNQSVKANDLLVKLDTTNDERAVRDAEANLESAQLSLQTLLAPATTSSILQARQASVQAEQSSQTAQYNIVSDYNSAYTDISDTFIDLPGVMTNLNNVLYGTFLNRVQNDIDAYTNLIITYFPNVIQYSQSAAAAYQTALSTYNQSLADYKASSVYSSTSTVESLLNETFNTLKIMSVANSNAKNLLDIVSNVLQQYNQKPPTQLNTDEASMQSYITTTNNHLATIIQIQNALQNDKQSLITSNLSVAQTEAALEQLLSGPTDLAVQTQELNVTKAQNALKDAQANLQYDYVRAPFDGVVTNITAKIGQPTSGSVATLVSNTQLAQATLNEVDVVNVKVGEQATVTFDALPNLTLTGKVFQVDTLGTVVQGVVSYNVQIALDVPNAQIKSGMSDNVSIVTNVKQDVLLVPNSAVTTKQGISYVQVMDALGKPVQTQVMVGLVNDTMTEISSGLNEGDSVVTKTITNSATQAQTTTNGLGGLRIFGGGPGR